MKKSIIIIFLFTGIVYSDSCIDTYEKIKIVEDIQNNDTYYSDVKNYIQCKNEKNILEQVVCKNENYLLMFKLLSQTLIYAYENATKKEVNHQTFNQTNMHWKISAYATQFKIDTDKLCFDLKDITKSALGDSSPYMSVSLDTGQETKLYFIQNNKDGSVLKSRDAHIIYLGKSCDVVDNKGARGVWNRVKDTYTIIYGENKLYFYEENLQLKRYKCDDTIRD